MKKGGHSAAAALRVAAAAALVAAIPLLAACGNRTQPVRELSSVRQSITRLLQLPTCERVYRDVIYVDKSGPFSFLGFGGGNALFSVEIRVRAGILSGEPVRVARAGEGGVIVYLPAARVLSVDTDESSIHEYRAHAQLLGGTNQSDYYDALELVKTRITADAVEAGILTRASENAHRMIEGLLRAAGFEHIEFVEEATV